MKKAFIILTLLIVTISCNKNETPLYLAHIGQGNLYGGGGEGIPAGNQIIKKEKDWEELLTKINSVNKESDNFTETDINFNDFIVIACFEEVKSTGGYAIEAIEIETTKKEVIVSIERTSPLEMATQVITQPFHIVKIPKTRKDIVFE